MIIREILILVAIGLVFMIYGMTLNETPNIYCAFQDYSGGVWRDSYGDIAGYAMTEDSDIQLID